MGPVSEHSLVPDAAFDGGDLDCGNGLLLLIRRHIDPLRPGELLEIHSVEPSVEEDLPAWCRLTGNELVSWTRDGHHRSYLVSKGPLRFAAAAGDASSVGSARSRSDEAASGMSAAHAQSVASSASDTARVVPGRLVAEGREISRAPTVAPFSVMGVGSWPRPRWLLAAMQDRMEGRLDEAEFEATADDAVRLAVAAQTRAGVDVVTDGEQRRDSYASFVGARLANCQLVPLTDILVMVDDPEHLKKEFETLDVPASSVRHPVVFGRIRRDRPLATHELEFVRTLTRGPIKVALPGPYLLSRILWMDCIVDRAYASRESLAEDIVHVLRTEVVDLLAHGASIVQLDEPVLTEVVHGGEKHGTSFMCGALSEKGDVAGELAFARDLLSAVVRGLPRERLALHICRGNWTPDESVALSGDYRPLLPLLADVDVGTYFLELCTPRAGEIEVLKELPKDRRIGVGVLNPKSLQAEDPVPIARRMEAAAVMFGADRVVWVPDCGFATFAHNPVASAAAAEAKLAAIAAARDLVTGRARP